MKKSSIQKWLTVLGCVALTTISSPSTAAEVPGLLARYRSLDHEEATAVDVRSHIQLHVEPGDSPTPFLPAGRFEAEFTGQLSVDIRSRYSFRLTSGGRATLSIDGEVVAESENGEVIVDRVRLNKGPNPIRLNVTSPESGPTFVRLALQARRDPLLPVMPHMLSHESTEESARGAERVEGRALFLENRCAKCHVTDGGDIELERDAPAFAGIGDRLTADWMAKWILDPQEMRANASMPRLLHGETAEEDARAIAAYLATLTGDTLPKESGDAALGEELFEKLHCGFCHQTPGGDADDSLIELTRVADKFRPGALAAFLEEPEKHYAWIRMPNFALSSEEAAAISAFLVGDASPAASDTDSDAALIERGAKLVQTTGCLNCHSGELPNQHTAPSLADIATSQSTEGCIAETTTSRSPHYALSDTERGALKTFLAEAGSGFGRHVAAEFATREVESLQCGKCHGAIEVIPSAEWIGAKMKPESTEQILAHTLGYETRPLMESRMPAFKSRAGALAQGLAQSFGYAPATPEEETPINTEIAAIGSKLVSADGGFACVSCHGVGDVPAMAIFEVESAGINFTHSHDRLQKEFYDAWILSPVAIDPRSKMPAFFFNGQSPLPTILEGDATRQIDAIWEYFRGGNEMAPPPQP